MKNSALKWLWRVTDRHKLGIAFLLVIQAFLGISSVIFALLMRNVIDSAADGNSPGFYADFLLLVGLVTVQLILRAITRQLEESSRADIENACKMRLFSELLQKDYASVTTVHSGEWLNRLTSDAAICANGAVEILPGIAGMTVKMLGALTMILVLEPRFAYILFPGGATLLLLTYSFRKLMKSLHKNVQETDGKLRIFMQERLESLMVVRSFSAEKSTEAEAKAGMSGHKAARMKKTLFSNVCNLGFAAAMNGMYLFGLGYCGYGIIKGRISYGTLMAILQLIGQIQTPFANITGYLPKFYSMTASAERLMEAESFEDDCHSRMIPPDEIKNFYESDFSTLVLENIVFSYKTGERPEALRDFGFIIKKGEFTAITGHSGCGKSTVLKLLMCLYRPDSGERYLLKSNGDREVLTSEWHRLFAYVPQGNQLMSGTIREIVAFSEKEKMQNSKKIFRALEIACAEEFVSELEDEIDTFLGERGMGLSEGQLQRIAIARAIFSDNPILLLDEATSALDEQTERKLLENLRSMTNKTVLIVTHRPAALEICDRIIKMSEN